MKFNELKIDALVASMPNGMNGFMKDWGLQQFAEMMQAQNEQALTVARNAANSVLSLVKVEATDAAAVGALEQLKIARDLLNKELAP